MNLLDANGPVGTYPNSYFVASVEAPPPLPPLGGDIDAEICVIGAGYTGMSAALHLAEAGKKVTVIDAHRIGWGASGRNGGQVGTGQRRDQLELEKLLGPDQARRLWDIAESAKTLVRELIATHKIACDYASGIIEAAHKNTYVPEIRDYVTHLNTAYGHGEIAFLDKKELADAIGTDVYFGGWRDWSAGHLNPFKYILGLARAAQEAGATIFEQTRALKVIKGDPLRIETDHGTIRAEKLLVAANGYLGLLLPEVAARVMPINSYMAATEPMEPARAKALIPDNVAVYDTRFVVNYYRLSADHRMLFGGRESYGYTDPKDISSAIRKRMLGIYPGLADLRIDYDWGGTLGISMNRMPLFRHLGPNILNASGFSGHGVAMATMAGALMAEALQGRPKRFNVMAEVPVPRFPGGTAFRHPLLVLAMLFYAFRDHL